MGGGGGEHVMMGRAGSGCLTASLSGRDLLSTVLMLADLHAGLLRKAETQQPPDPFGTSLRGQPAAGPACWVGETLEFQAFGIKQLQ